MITPDDGDILQKPKKIHEVVRHFRSKESSQPNALDTSHHHHVLLHNKFITHNEKSGLNPLVDAAAYLFSVIGKLKPLKFYRNLSKLHKELVAEINAFQEAAKAQNYSPEYILVSRYALCATLDDIIANTPWGAQGQWDNYSLLTVFNQYTSQQERFFLILERISKDPALYIDVMELMYICLSLGFKGSYRSTEFSSTQLEQMTHALYKQIRAYRGNFSKLLSPFPSRVTAQPKIKTRNTSIPLALIITISLIVLLFLGLGFVLQTESNQSFQELMTIGKSILYETHST